MTHICIGKLTVISSDNDLAPGRRKPLSEPMLELGILLIGSLGANLDEISIGIQAH